MDLARIEELIRITRDARVSELTVRQDEVCVRIRKPAGAVPAATGQKKAVSKKAQPSNRTEGSPETGLLAITAPMVGIFHAGTNPVQPGVVVRPGQVVGAIESMKLMTDVISAVGGTVTQADIEDGLPVEYGQILFHLTPLEAE